MFWLCGTLIEGVPLRYTAVVIFGRYRVHFVAFARASRTRSRHMVGMDEVEVPAVYGVRGGDFPTNAWVERRRSVDTCSFLTSMDSLISYPSPSTDQSIPTCICKIAALGFGCRAKHLSGDYGMASKVPMLITKPWPDPSRSVQVLLECRSHTFSHSEKLQWLIDTTTARLRTRLCWR